MATRQRNQILLVLFLGVLMAALDIAIVGPALPAIKAAFGVDERALAWLFSIYVLFNLVGTPLLAKLSDLFGRRLIYTAAIGLFALGSLIVALAPGLAVMLAGRAVQGLGAGGIFPVASAVIGDTFPPEQRGSALGLIGAVFGIAFLVGPILGGLLLLLGWQWLFLINLPLAALVIALGMRLLPATGAGQGQHVDWAGMLLLGALLALLAFGLSQLGEALRGVTATSLLAALAAPAVWPFLLSSLLLAPLVWLVERRAADPVLNVRLVRNRQIVLAGALSFGAGLAEAVTLFIPALLVAAFQVSYSTASFMLVPMVLGMAVGSPFSGRMLDRAGSKLVVLSGTALISSGLLLQGMITGNLVIYYIFTVLFGLGIGVLLGASLRYILLNETAAHERASAQGVLTVFISIGQLVGAALMGAVASAGGGGPGGYALALLVTGVIMLGLTLASFGLKGRAAELATVH